MADLLLSDFFEAMRIALGDEGTAGSYDYTDEQLSGALRTVVKSGGLPCVAVNPLDPTKLSPAPPNPDTWGYLMFKACLVLRGGYVAQSVRTRAFSASIQPMAVRDTVHHLENMITEIEARGNLCGSATDTSDKGLFVANEDVLTICRSWATCLTPEDLTDCCE